MVNHKIAVLGSGIGGLTAALKLQRNLDAEITIYERSTAPGGRTRTLEIEGNMYDIGSTIITPHLLHIIKSELGVSDIKTVPVNLDIIATEEREPMRLDFGLTSIEDIEKILDEGSLSTAWILSKVAIEGLEHIEDMHKMSMYDYLNELKDLPDKMKAYLSAGFIASNVSVGKLEATAFDLLAYSHSFQYPEGGVGQIAEKLANTFNSRGGTIYYSSQINSITYSDTGVSLEIENVETKKKMINSFDYVISNIGVGHTFKAITNDTSTITKDKTIYKTTEPTIQPTLLMYKMKEKPDFKGRAGMTLYYPLNTMKEINEYIGDVENGGNPIHGFYIHYPALNDPKASKVGEYPIQLWFPSQQNPSDDVIEQFKAYGTEQMHKYFIEDFSSKAELVNVFRPIDANPIYNDPGTVSQIAPHVGYPVFDSKLTDRVYMVGSGAGIKFSPSTIQAQMSGLVVANDLIDKLKPLSWFEKFIAWLKSIF